MKIELIKSNTLTNGIRDINARFGPSAYILRNIESHGETVLVIAHEENAEFFVGEPNPKTALLKMKGSSTDKAPTVTNEEIELLKSTIKSLPKSFDDTNDVVKDELQILTESSLFNKKGPSNSMMGLVEEQFLELLDETPTSKQLKTRLSNYVKNPKSKNELLSQIEFGVNNDFPGTKDVKIEKKVHIIAGGYGVGKTSMAFKMASQIRNVHKQPASVISLGVNIDDNRAELDIISTRLNVPNYFVKDVRGLEKVIDINGDNVYIIDIDTASATEAIPFIRGQYREAQFHLVTPTDSCISSLRTNCELYKWDSIMFTRLDSPLVPWAAIEALSEYRIPLSIGSTSSSLTTDLVRVSKENISRRLIEFLNFNISGPDNMRDSLEVTRINALH